MQHQTSPCLPIADRAAGATSIPKYPPLVGRDVKVPRTVKRYCPKCETHRSHDVERVRKKRASELKWGQRRFRKVTAGYRGFPRPKPEGREKPTKRVLLRYVCQQCSRTHQPAAQRAKRFELTEVA